MTFPLTPPFSFVDIPDFVFDQVLTFNTMNVLLNDVRANGSSLSEEHTFSDGAHKRITKGQNLLRNPSGHLNTLYWQELQPGGGDFIPANDPKIAEDNSLDGEYAPYINYQGTTISADDTFTSDKIETSATTDAFVLSALIRVPTLSIVGSDSFFKVYCEAFNVSDVSQGTFCKIEINSVVADWTLFEITEALPATSVYFKVIIEATKGTGTPTIEADVRQIKIERGSIATAYSDDQSKSWGVAFHAQHSANQTITAGAGATKVEFPGQRYDFGGDNYSTVNDRFTAPRHGIYHFNVGLWIFASAAAYIATLSLVRRDSGGSILQTTDINYATGVADSTRGIYMNGSDAFEMDEGDFVEVFMDVFTNNVIIQSINADAYFSGHQIGA